ncbi:MAG TPA: Gfo/Idh/MocA family oxidoreductase [Planctomycetota bacterium]|nr:Gfo/Idh/MocA family oxidoreductase [Planctomycetota bacterium]
MIRIGIVGSDNSHAIALSQLCNLSDTPERKAIRGARVVALFGLVPERNDEVARAGKIPTIVAKPTEMIGMVDAVFVVFRHGGLHCRYVRPFLQARIPAFVDKPLACSTADARKILALAKRNKVLLTSYSTVRWAKGTQELIGRCGELGGVRSGVFGCPSDPTSEYGGIHFYAIHAVEAMQQIMGLGATEVTARQSGKNTVAAVSYGDGRTATLHLLADAKHGFYATAFCKEGVAGGVLDISDCYVAGLQRILAMLRTGQRPLVDAEMLEPIRVLDAIVKSAATGQTVRLRPMKA